MKLVVRSLSVKPAHGSGKLIALADAALTWEDMTLEIRSIRIEKVGLDGSGGTKVCMPVDREGRPVLILPPELAAAVGDVVLAAGIDAGILKERETDTIPAT